MFLNCCRLLSLGVLGFCLLSSQSLRALTLSESFRLAKTRDPIYLSAQAQKRIADTLLREAQSAYMPSVSALANVDSTYPFPSSSSSTQLPRSWYFRGVFSISAQQFLFNATTSGTVKSAKLRAQAASYQVREAEYNLVMRVMDAYFAVLSARATLENLYARRKVLLEQMRQARRSFDSGATTIADVQSSQAQYSLAAADIVAAQAKERVAQAALRTVVGQNVDNVDSLSVDGLGMLNRQVVNNPLNYWISTARIKSPSILSKDLLFKAAKNDISVQKASHFPTLGLTASSSYLSLDLTSSTPSTIEPSLAVTLQLSLPLFSGGLNAARTDEYVHKSVAAYEDYRQTYNQINLMTEQSYLDFMNGLSQINALKVALSSVKTALEANQSGYRTGTKVLLDVLTAENQVYSTELQLISQVVSTLKAYINLKIYSGDFSEDNLSFVDSCLVETN